jgi:hypothetical protein
MMWCGALSYTVPSGLRTRHVSQSHLASNSRSFPNPIERIESLRPDLRFRVPLADNSMNELEVVR